MPLDWDEIAEMVYECTRCGYRFKGKEMIFRNKIVCPQCGYKVIKKLRPPIVRRMKAV